MSKMLDTIICGDCLEVLKTLETGSVDLTVTSPPYDNLRTYHGYVFDFEGIVQELFRVMKQGGVVVWVVGDATIKGSETGTSFRQALYFKEIGFNLHDTMIFRKLCHVPLTHNRYEQAFEYMFVLSRGKPKTVNHIKVPTKTGGRVRNYKNRKSMNGQNASLRVRDEVWITNLNRIKNNVWEFPVGNNDKTSHPAPFPKQLAHDHIISWSNPGDLVLDPMCGSGTTCVAAKLLNRHYIGIDISQEYCSIARTRLSSTPIFNSMFSE